MLSICNRSKKSSNKLQHNPISKSIRSETSQASVPFSPLQSPSAHPLAKVTALHSRSSWILN
jgi:hypothetical protein